jgi:glycerol-3-phosphate dehydrogenase (NAD(P)+)
MSRVAVIGAGAWGTTLSILLAENGHAVTLWAYEADLIRQMMEERENKRFLPGCPLPAGIEVTGDPQKLSATELCFIAVPTQHLRATVGKLAGALPPGAVLVSAGKGIEDKTLKLPLQIIKEATGRDELCALSGPNLSAEIARGLPAAAVVAAERRDRAEEVRTVLLAERFRVYTNDDVTGVQLGGALKNVIAIAAGVADGLGLGDNAKAGLLIRGIAEISRLGVALGARAETFAGLSGMGDLIATCSSQLSRNHRVGEQVAKGRKIKDILAAMPAVAEGVPTTLAARELGIRHKINLPITEEVYQVLYKDKDAYRALSALLTRLPTSE